MLSFIFYHTPKDDLPLLQESNYSTPTLNEFLLFIRDLQLIY